jgi:hypothetical protein
MANQLGKEFKAVLRPARQTMLRAVALLREMADGLEKAVPVEAIEFKATVDMPSEPEPPAARPVPPRIERPVRQAPAPQIQTGYFEDKHFDGSDSAESRVLRALSMIDGSGHKKRIGVLSGVNPKKSTWRGAMAVLKQAGLITVAGDTVSLTDLGRSQASQIEAISADDRIKMWKSKFDGGANRIFSALLAAKRPMTRDELGSASGIDPALSTWRGAMAQVRASGFLVEVDGEFSVDEALYL